MTNEEAIQELKVFLSNGDFYYLSGDAANLAIEALEQEPCEDAISRQAVKELYYKNGYIDFHKIHDLPPVTPQPKTGHWIEDENEMKVWCSECGEENDNCSKHCPNCGAKMVKPQESEE